MPSRYEPATVKLVKGHGTSTRVEAMRQSWFRQQIFSNLGSGDKVAVSSIKSQIGHLKAAGMAGMLKTTLALHNGIIPQSAGLRLQMKMLIGQQIHFTYQLNQRIGLTTDNQTPRRAGSICLWFWWN